MIFTRFSSCLVLLLAATAGTAQAQFSCTLTATDENSCLGTTADDGKHCVWCAVSSFGFCVSEAQAESMESNIPGVQCDRYSGSDDDATPSDDDKTPANDDAAPSPNDDSLPDNYWLCLKKKDLESCTKEGCTWCDSKGGFGLCLTGPSAKMAEDSDWFTCQKEQDDKLFALAKDPYDASCVMSYLQDPSEEGCTSTMDQDGQACLWCSLAGMANLCLSQEQADMASSLGVTCEEDDKPQQLLRGGAGVQDDPYDTSCLMAYLMDPTEDGCKAAVDEDGGPCEFCSFQDSINLCLTEEQAEMGEQMGLTCDKENTMKANDPMDPSCALAYMEDQSEDACKSAVDADGNPCEYCTLQGAINLCLNEDQAQIAEQYGVECSSSVAVQEKEEVTFPSDFWECLENYDEGGCGDNSCTWCNTEVGMGFCVSDAVADAMRECNFFDCNYKAEMAITEDTTAMPFDPSCLQGLESKEVCASTMDTTGNACVWCDGAGVFGLCLSADGAKAAGEYMSCDAVALLA